MRDKFINYLFFNHLSMKKLSTLMVLLFAMSMFVSSSISFAQDSDDVFTDVQTWDLNAEAIQTLKDNGVVDGYPDGSYQPYREINRAEFTKIMMEAAYGYDPNNDFSAEDIYSSAGLSFSDIENNAWYIPYLRKAVEANVIDGYPDGTFKPGDNINFAESSKIIANSFGLDLGTEDPEIWYRRYVEGLEGEQAIPMSVEYFDEEVSRDEMAEMVFRITEDVETKATRTFAEITGDNFVTGQSCLELTERFDARYYDGSRGGAVDDFFVEEAAMAVPMADGEADFGTAGAVKLSAAPGDTGSDEYSSTNIQVEGVDEADIIKNDGKYIYLIKGSTIRIIEAYPASNLEELAVFSFGEDYEEFYPSEMYTDGNQLTVIGSIHGYITMDVPVHLEGDPMAYPSYYSNRTKVFVLDITNRNAPEVERTVEIEGNYKTSRKVDDTLYMVVNHYRGWIYNTDEGPLVPLMRDSVEGDYETVVGCADIHILPKPQSFNYLITAAIPLDSPTQKVSRSVVVGDGDNVYSSRDYMYIAATDWGGGYWAPYEERGTIVYRYELGEGSIAFTNKGRVPGHVLNQFSMDEYKSHFRIATTSDGWDSEMSNNLFVLGSDMNVTGEITGIAPTEKIYSVRFMGDRAYMVTFKRTDPLFVIDLSNARDPKILGELKIPGFSNYLHPYDENHIIGFGKDVDEDQAQSLSSTQWLAWEAVQGMKLGLFDVTDVNNPKEMFVEVIGDRGTNSELLYNHKALLFDEEKDLLAFPVTVVEIPDDQCSEETYSSCPESCAKQCVPKSCISKNGVTVCTPDCDGVGSCTLPSWEPGETIFAGAYVYDIDLQNGFTFKGGITHLNSEEIAEMKDYSYAPYQKTVQRILYIGENLYTVSQSMVKANFMSSLAERNAIELAGESYDYWYPEEPMPLM
ncbi:beta-propeller domain-containing protein [Pseudomonadota bacterium]